MTAAFDPADRFVGQDGICWDGLSATELLHDLGLRSDRRRTEPRALFDGIRDRMMAVGVTAVGNELQLSPPHQLFERAYAYGAGITIANYTSRRMGDASWSKRTRPSAGFA